MPDSVTQSPINISQANGEIFAALAKAQENAKTVGKDGWNNHSRYKYTTADDMIAAGRAARSGTGLALLTSWSSQEIEGGDKGGQWPCAKVTLHWVLGHASGGILSGAISMIAMASKLRPADKATAAAATYVEGFLERGLMRLDRSEETQDDVDRRPVSEEPSPRSSSPMAKAPASVSAAGSPALLRDASSYDEVAAWCKTHGQVAIDARGPEPVESAALKVGARFGATKGDIMKWLHGEIEAA